MAAGDFTNYADEKKLLEDGWKLFSPGSYVFELKEEKEAEA